MNKSERLSRLLVCPEEEIALRDSHLPYALDYEKLNWQERVVVWGLHALNKKGHWRNVFDSFRRPSDRDLLLSQQEALSLRWHADESAKRPKSTAAFWGLNAFLAKRLDIPVEVNPNQYPERGSTMSVVNGEQVVFPNLHFVFTPKDRERGIHQVMVYGRVVDLTVALQGRESTIEEIAQKCGVQVTCRPYKELRNGGYLYRLQAPLHTLHESWCLQVTKVPFEQAQAFLPPQQGVPQSV